MSPAIRPRGLRMASAPNARPGSSHFRGRARRNHRPAGGGAGEDKARLIFIRQAVGSRPQLAVQGAILDGSLTPAFSRRERERRSSVAPQDRRDNFITWLEHLHQICSSAFTTRREAVFLVFGFVSAQAQVIEDMPLRQSLAKNQKSSLRTATSFLSML